FTFVLGVEPPQDLNETREASPAEKAPAVRIHSAHEEALSEAVSRARAARGTGVGDQTLDIMRDMLYAALRRARRKLKITIAVLLAALAAGSAFAYWKIETLRVEKDRIDAAIANLEKVIETAALSGRDVGSLADRIDEYESQGRALQSTMLYRMGVDHAADPVERQIRELLAEFGSETYRVPTEFRDQVTRFIVRYQGPDRPHIIAALGRSKREIQTMRRILEDAHIPPDLAYMAVVESALGSGGKSGAGAAGIWQFTPVTARNYGLTVNGAVDERLDVRKSTRAAAKMLRELILDFGAGSSVMLALAAYNSGPARVRQEIRKVADPIKQRNFWHLYRVHALPAETREYVPKVIAAMIIGRDPGQFGFES
ncbi:MAG TPA: lytic transglycosylase domain-containing protein, partial [Bryobacteraceae bacterium]|nr:lytic transglycosylase domain-containing protein [Bryobacteraceae bacterium]